MSALPLQSYTFTRLQPTEPIRQLWFPCLHWDALGSKVESKLGFSSVKKLSDSRLFIVAIFKRWRFNVMLPGDPIIRVSEDHCGNLLSNTDTFEICC